MNKTIGLVGRPGSGKSTISNILKTNFGFCIVNVDAIGHAVLNELGKYLLIKEFGKKVITAKNTVNREVLADIVFTDPERLDKLNSLVHPKIYEFVKNGIKTGKNILDAALLFEIGLDELCDEVWFVDAPFDVRLERVKERDWDEEELKGRESYFLSDKELTERCDRLILNSGSRSGLIENIETLLGLCLS